MTANSQVNASPKKDRTNFFKAVWAITAKDLAAEWRSREVFSAMFIFAFLVILIFNFSLELNLAERQKVTSGVLWVSFIFAGTLGLNRSMAIEKDRGCLDGLLLAPVDRSSIFFGKAIGNLIFMSIVEILILPLYSIFYNTNLFNPGLIGVIVLGSIGYAVVGTLLSSMTVQTRTRDVLLPIVLFPLILPILINAVKVSSIFIEVGFVPETIFPLQLLAAFDVIYITMAFMFFDFVVEE